MTLTEIQPYLTAISAVLGVTTLAFLLNVLKTIRDNAQDRIAIQEERLKSAAEEHQRTEKWAQREKEQLNEQLAKAKADLDLLLKNSGLDLNALSLGRQLSESAVEVRAAAKSLVEEMKAKLAELASLIPGSGAPKDAGVELSLAMGAMASGSYEDAAHHFDSYARSNDDSWQTHFSRGVAHANSRNGKESNLAALRAYNEAIALAPIEIDKNWRARLFTYRGAMLKRLDRLVEAEADIRIALAQTNDADEVLDARYNLACIYAMREERELMMKELSLLREDTRYLRAVASHLRDYFSPYIADREFLQLLSGYHEIGTASARDRGAPKRGT